ncbi:class II fructose-1,6-bisphosphate aldolase [Spiroplasma endosymbiont of Asaphidion curtum]|uniref:class II fructose-1,6-bisphosphate aldolase n=1 Tax=Spiroplasma endosymbiont of Asaphidion curtum TaxID=3066281 RepID=UPI00313B7697
MAKLVNPTVMLQKARKENYAIAHFNINNLEWIKAILKAVQETNSPVILGVSEGAIKYMGGVKTVYGLVTNLMDFIKVTVPIVLHLDHGQTVESCIAAIDAGFSSVMFDGSHHPLAENLKLTAQVVEYAHRKNVAVEAEVGTIGGEEDGVIGTGELATLDECQAMKNLAVDFLAAGINNIHGPYPKNWDGLKLDLLKNISENISLPLVLHGGSGIDMEQIKQAISLGISKINVNTELQLEFQQATRQYIVAEKDQTGKGYDPRKLLNPGIVAVENKAKQLLAEFGSLGKA